MTYLEKLNILRSVLYVELFMDSDGAHIWVYTNDQREDPEFDREGNTLEDAINKTYTRFLEWKQK